MQAEDTRSVRATGQCCNRQSEDPIHLVRKDRLQAAAEIAEVIALLVHLDTLPVVFDLREHPVRAFLHSVLNGLASFSLPVNGKEHI